MVWKNELRITAFSNGRQRVHASENRRASGGMFLAQRQLFADSPHIGLPGSASTNDWLRAFEWIRHNTPPNAVFAIDPNYMLGRPAWFSGNRGTQQASR